MRKKTANKTSSAKKERKKTTRDSDSFERQEESRARQEFRSGELERRFGYKRPS
jgi:hypothetical protein